MVLSYRARVQVRLCYWLKWNKQWRMQLQDINGLLTH